jgi:hypothetical protein
MEFMSLSSKISLHVIKLKLQLHLANQFLLIFLYFEYYKSVYESQHHGSISTGNHGQITIICMEYFIITLSGVTYDYVVNGRNGSELWFGWKVYRTKEVVGNWQ